MIEPQYHDTCLQFGILGRGSYGTKVESKLSRLGDVLWSIGSDSDYSQLTLPNWVFVCTPNIFHFEQCEYFLLQAVNVFVAKPAVLCPRALQQLISLAEENDCKIYIDDVYLYWRRPFSFDGSSSDNRFIWEKPEGSESYLLDRLCYHHLYLIYNQFGRDVNFELLSVDCSLKDSIEFTASISGARYSFSYKSTNATVAPIHSILGVIVSSPDNDPLYDMLKAVIQNTASFSLNHDRATWVAERIENIRSTSSPTVAVVGGGVFGCSAAIELANQGFNVTLYEKNTRVMMETSAINQYRVHRGYHYPRSEKTAAECKHSAPEFVRKNKQAISHKSDLGGHYYAIATNNSLTTKQEYLDFLEKLDLPYKKSNKLQGTDLTVKVDELLFDPDLLRYIYERRLLGSGVSVKLGTEVGRKDIKDHDFSVIATYSKLNQWSDKKVEYQFEVIEKPAFRLAPEYSGKSIVVMDGPFMCIDPLGSTDLHVMGNVVHAIHSTNTGYSAVVPRGYEDLINKGMVKHSQLTKVSDFIESAKEFFPNIEDSEYMGSMFTIRTVLPYREADDARPTIVNWTSDNSIQLFSGKVCTCLFAAAEVCRLIHEKSE